MKDPNLSKLALECARQAVLCPVAEGARKIETVLSCAGVHIITDATFQKMVERDSRQVRALKLARSLAAMCQSADSDEIRNRAGLVLETIDAV